VLILKQLKVPLESITFEKQGGGYPVMVNQVLETSHPLSFPLRSDAKLASRMVLWDVLPPRRSRRSDVQTFGRVSDPSPLFSDPCGHSYTTATRQLLCNQFVTHSFHRDGGWGTPNVPTLRRSNVQTSPYRLRLGNTCTEGQIDGTAGAVEHGCHERSHCSLTPAKFASLS
jgi:hypothetical protein